MRDGEISRLAGIRRSDMAAESKSRVALALALRVRT